MTHAGSAGAAQAAQARPHVFHSRALDCTGSSSMHLRRLFPHGAAIMLSCKLTMYT